MFHKVICQISETEELAVTPRQELAKMGLCKEDLFMCSQPADSQIDVRWDCNSPEALLQFKRCEFICSINKLKFLARSALLNI